MDIAKALEKLYSLQKFGVKLGLSNIENLLEHLGNPQNKYKTFHIAGTNGKGSTSSFIASILKEMGYKTGLYTSPHFVKFNERIRINGSEIPDEYIALFVNSIFDYIGEYQPTFFEVTTALCFKYFSDEKIDYAVIETGLGGRLDATNVLKPLASIITSISLDHVEILGDTIEAIAGEKAGIIKEGRAVFIGKLPIEAEKVIRRKSQEMNSRLFRAADYTGEENGQVSFCCEKFSIDRINTPLKGVYQKYNASLAILAVSETLNFHNENVFIAGIENVKDNTGIQGRYEIYNEEPKVIFDSAHNPEGIKCFLSAFSEESKNYKKRTLLYGAMKDKAIKEILNSLSPFFDEIFVTEIDYERSATIELLSSISRSIGLDVKKETDGANFIKQFINEKKDECLVVLGSMYVLGKIKEALPRKKA